MRIQFIESPTGAYKLAYDAGMYADLPDELAKELIEKNYAKAVKPDERILKSETAETRATVSGNNRTSKRGRKSKRGQDLPESRDNG